MSKLNIREDWDLDAVKVLDHVVQRAAAIGASDIHIEPKRQNLRVRFRIDGVMNEQGTLPAELAAFAASRRVKVLGRMDMTIRRLPQDGQFSLDLADGNMVHLRASTFPAIHGETLRHARAPQPPAHPHRQAGHGRRGALQGAAPRDHALGDDRRLRSDGQRQDLDALLPDPAGRHQEPERGHPRGSDRGRVLRGDPGADQRAARGSPSRRA